MQGTIDLLITNADTISEILSRKEKANHDFSQFAKYFIRIFSNMPNYHTSCKLSSGFNLVFIEPIDWTFIIVSCYWSYISFIIVLFVFYLMFFSMRIRENTMCLKQKPGKSITEFRVPARVITHLSWKGLIVSCVCIMCPALKLKQKKLLMDA